jgi:hypothetical protein
MRGHLPFYIPKGFPVSIPSLEKRLGAKFDAMIEIDGAGQFHVAGLKNFSEKKILWSCDIQRQDKQKFHKWIADDFDFIFSAQKNFVPFFGPKTAWLPYACNDAVYRNLGLPKIYDVGVVGNMDAKVYPNRVKLVDELSKRFKVGVFSGVFGPEACKVYCQSKIVFNNSHGGELNMRIFEAMGTGSMLMADRLSPETGLYDLFEDKKHLVIYDGSGDLIEKVSYYLEHADERESIARSGYEEVCANHTITHRLKTMLEILNA